jgi:hypothetical protein
MLYAPLGSACSLVRCFACRGDPGRVIRDLYVESSVGRALTDTINHFTRNHGVTACFQHDIRPEMQRHQKVDEWWIADIASRGMAILTQDAAILGIRQRLQQGIVTAERQAVVDNAAHVFAFGDANTASDRSFAACSPLTPGVRVWGCPRAPVGGACTPASACAPPLGGPSG